MLLRAGNQGVFRISVQAGSEASPAGGGGWAGAREACTAAPHSGSPSVVRSTVLPTGAVDSFELAASGLLACRPIRANWSAGHVVCLGCAEHRRSVTGASDTRRLAQRCALRRGYEARESRQSRRQLRCRRWPSFKLCPSQSPGICGKIAFVHRYVRVELDVVAPTGI